MQERPLCLMLVSDVLQSLTDCLNHKVRCLVSDGAHNSQLFSHRWQKGELWMCIRFNEFVAIEYLEVKERNTVIC